MGAVFACPARRSLHRPPRPRPQIDAGRANSPPKGRRARGWGGFCVLRCLLGGGCQSVSEGQEVACCLPPEHRVRARPALCFGPPTASNGHQRRPKAGALRGFRATWDGRVSVVGGSEAKGTPNT